MSDPAGIRHSPGEKYLVQAHEVRKIGGLALTDAFEILLLIAVMETQNSGKINERISDAGAAQGELSYETLCSQESSFSSPAVT